jgi:hypothetical protein
VTPAIGLKAKQGQTPSGEKGNLSGEPQMADVNARQALSDGLRYWEPRRILYNLALLLVVGVVFIANLPASQGSLTFDTLQGLFVLAVLANVAYCAAYIVDVVLQLSAFRPIWLRRRWVLLVIGIAFGAVLANLFSHGLFGASAT